MSWPLQPAFLPLLPFCLFAFSAFLPFCPAAGPAYAAARHVHGRESAMGRLATSLFTRCHLQIGIGSCTGPIVLLYLQHNPRIQDWMRAQNISDVRALEQHYVRRLLQLAAAASASPPAWLLLMFVLPAAAFMSHAACRLCAAAPVAKAGCFTRTGYGSTGRCSFQPSLLRSCAMHCAPRLLQGASPAPSLCVKARISSEKTAFRTAFDALLTVCRVQTGRTSCGRRF